MIMNDLQMKIIYLNTKANKIIFVTPTYRHNGVLITQYYDVKNANRIFTTCCNEQYLLQILG